MRRGSLRELVRAGQEWNLPAHVRVWCGHAMDMARMEESTRVVHAWLIHYRSFEYLVQCLVAWVVASCCGSVLSDAYSERDACVDRVREICVSECEG